jgi:hypothetical protein
VNSGKLDAAGIRSMLESIGKRLDAADRRGAHYAEVYGLVRLENQYREELARLESKQQEVVDGVA